METAQTELRTSLEVLGKEHCPNPCAPAAPSPASTSTGSAPFAPGISPPLSSHAVLPSREPCTACPGAGLVHCGS